MSTAASSSAIFNGTSRFSSDFQAVITRAVGIASLPITQLNTAVTGLQTQATAITGLGTKFSALQSAVKGLQNATGIGSLTSSVSDGSAAQVNISTGAVPATYTLQVTSLGSYTNTLSNDGLTTVADPNAQNLSSDTSFTLKINNVSTTITPAAQNLNALVEAINTQPGLNVQASVVNVGSGSAPDYRLSLQSTKLGPVSLELDGNAGDLTNTLSTGTLAGYQVDGRATTINSDSRTITLAPGVTVNLLAQSQNGAGTIAVSQQTGAVSNALSTLVSAYNAAEDALNANRGSSAGPLEGQSLIQSLSSVLQQLGSYSTGSSGLNSLASLGVTYDTTGHLAFDAAAFSSATSSQIAGLNSFLGGATTGGFLQTATNLLNQVQDSKTGLIATSATSVQTEINTDTDRIATDQTESMRCRQTCNSNSQSRMRWWQN